MLKKRIKAYIIDMIIVTLLTSFLFTLPIFEKQQESYLNNYETYMKNYEGFVSGEIKEKDMLNSEYKMLKSSSTMLIIRVSILIIYFSILPYFKNGQTLGKKISKIKIVSIDKEPINPGLFFLRGLISSLAILDIISLFILLLCNQTIYLTTSIILGYANTILYIVMFETALIRKDKRSLHDLIARTKVEEIKQN